MDTFWGELMKNLFVSYKEKQRFQKRGKSIMETYGIGRKN